MKLEVYDEGKHGPLLTGILEDIVYERTSIECPDCHYEMTALPSQQGWAPGSLSPEWVLKEHFICENAGCGRTWIKKQSEHERMPAIQGNNITETWL